MSFSVDRCTRITRSVSFAIVRALQPARSLPNFVIHGHVLSVMSRKVSDVSIFIHHILNFRGIWFSCYQYAVFLVQTDDRTGTSPSYPEGEVFD